VSAIRGNHSLLLERVGRLICWGTLAGNLLAVGAAGVLRSQLYGVSATDPWTILAADVVLALVAAIAVAAPTARAVAVDAAEVLRAD
jgi:putative ABC transport system permease protein